MDEPFLSSVVWTGGQYYYCWIILQDDEPLLSVANYSRQLTNQYTLNKRYAESGLFGGYDDGTYY
jgi:hypothetical protein